MAGSQRLLAIAMAFSLAGIPGHGKPDALGIIVQADHASLGSQACLRHRSAFNHSGDYWGNCCQRSSPSSDCQVRLVGQHELIVFARRGPAQISYRGESETIAEGKSYRVLLNPSDDGASGGKSAKRPGKRSKALLLVAIGVAAAAGITVAWRAIDKDVESPDQP